MRRLKRASAALVGVAIVVAAMLAIILPYLSGRTRLTELPSLGKAGHAQSGFRVQIPRPAHVIVIIEENKSFGAIIGDDDAPFINKLAREGALFTQSFAAAHPSQPNYLALFSGVPNADGDACPQTTVARWIPSLGGRLRSGTMSFAGYSQGLPTVGYRECAVPGSDHGYARKHNPWVNFDDVPAEDNRPLETMPRRFDSLPTVSFIVPDLAHDMHSGSIRAGDDWLRENVGPIVAWSMHNNAVVIVTWDESDYDTQNHIATIFVGEPVKPGSYDERVDHYRVLRTIEEMYGLSPLGASTAVSPITDCWVAPATRPN